MDARDDTLRTEISLRVLLAVIDAVGINTILSLDRAHNLLVNASVVAGAPPSDRWYALFGQLEERTTLQRHKEFADEDLDRKGAGLLLAAATFFVAEVGDLEEQIGLLDNMGHQVLTAKIEQIVADAGQAAVALLDHANRRSWRELTALHNCSDISRAVLGSTKTEGPVQLVDALSRRPSSVIAAVVASMLAVTVSPERGCATVPRRRHELDDSLLLVVDTSLSTSIPNGSARTAVLEQLLRAAASDGPPDMVTGDGATVVVKSKPSDVTVRIEHNGSDLSQWANRVAAAAVSLAPDQGDSDLLEALYQAARHASNARSLILVSSDIVKARILSLCAAEWDVSPVTLTEELRRRDALPNLAGRTVVFADVGNHDPNDKHPTATRWSLEAYCTAICKAAGVASCHFAHVKFRENAAAEPIHREPANEIFAIRGDTELASRVRQRPNIGDQALSRIATDRVVNSKANLRGDATLDESDNQENLADLAQSIIDTAASEEARNLTGPVHGRSGLEPSNQQARGLNPEQLPVAVSMAKSLLSMMKRVGCIQDLLDNTLAAIQTDSFTTIKAVQNAIESLHADWPTRTAHFADLDRQRAGVKARIEELAGSETNAEGQTIGPRDKNRPLEIERHDTVVEQDRRDDEKSTAFRQLIDAYQRFAAANPDISEHDLAQNAHRLFNLCASVTRVDWDAEAVPAGCDSSQQRARTTGASEFAAGAPFILNDPSREDRSLLPSPKFAEQANATSALYEQANANPDGFWATQADRLYWDAKWNRVLDWSNAPFARWFIGGKLNVAYNCVDRHVESGYGAQVAVHWEGEPGDRRTITYADLQDEVCQAANALTLLGLRAGDRVVIYMPTVPEAISSMLACARLGVIHNVVFSGFSADDLSSQIADTDAKLVITSDGQYRGGKPHPLKAVVDRAVAQALSVRNVLVVHRTGTKVDWTAGRDHWWHELVKAQSRLHEPKSFDSEHPLYILATSGSTGKPRGILHTTGGYLTQVAYTHSIVFDLKPDDVYWCTADIGWITGHSYVVYGPLANRASQVIYEGKPEFPHKGRHWEIVERYKVSVYYDAPTLIRTFMKWGADIPARYNRKSLRVLGSVGEPINPEAWMWYRKHIGDDSCPVVDTWWQTETGAIMISPLPGVTATKPGSAMTPLPGISAKVIDETGVEVPYGRGGYLVLDAPWPSMLRGIWGDEQGYKAYWSRFAGKYFTGDVAKYDRDGAIWLLGRVEDVINVSGHWISSTEVESALISHPKVAEAAVVGAGDVGHQRIVAFVILRVSMAEEEDIAATLRDHVTAQIGLIRTPRQIVVLSELPKTRSGKILRRLLRELAEKRDVTALAGSTAKDLIDAL